MGEGSGCSGSVALIAASLFFSAKTIDFYGGLSQRNDYLEHPKTYGKTKVFTSKRF